MSASTKVVVTGQCHCGTVKYQALGPIIRQGICSCRACQRATGALQSPNIGVAPGTLTVTTGSPSQFRSDSNQACDAGIWHFCNRCGTQLYWKDAQETEVAIFAGSLDDTSLFRNEDGE